MIHLVMFFHVLVAYYNFLYFEKNFHPNLGGAGGIF